MCVIDLIDISLIKQCIPLLKSSKELTLINTEPTFSLQAIELVGHVSFATAREVNDLSETRDRTKREVCEFSVFTSIVWPNIK